MALTRDVLRLLVRPVEVFFRTEAAGGVVLMVATIVALAWANSPWASSYVELWHAEVTIGTARVGISEPLVHWISDLLMAVFFLIAGLEIKRELLTGELSSPRKAALPALAALGGMLVPALVFLAMAPEPPASRGWGIPMTADIAFALGCLRLLGKRIPTGLIVFLTAIAIIDDLGAILIVAFFYAEAISLQALLFAAGFTAVLVVMNLLGARRPALFVLAGVPLWVAMMKSGLHPTISGVIVAFCVPARARYSREEVLTQSRELIALAEEPHSEQSTAALEALERRLDDCEPPLSRLQEGLHPWVAFGIVPLFALANAGVPLSGITTAELVAPTSRAIIVGLFLGNQLGVFGTTLLAVSAGLSPLPAGVTWRHLYGMSVLAGVGFTMSLFIADVAYRQEAALLQQAKVAILIGSFLAAVTGLLVLRKAPPAS